VNPQELQGKYARLRAELASLEGAVEYSKARQVRLALELDQIDRQLAAFRHLAQAAPTLQDVVMIADRPHDHGRSLPHGRGAAPL